MSDQGTEEKDLGAQDATLSAGDKPADTRIAPGVTEQNHTESEAGDASAAQPKKRQLTLRTIGAIAACAVALVAVFAGIGYATGLFGSAQPDEQVTQQQAQEQSASASSTSVKQSTSGQPDNSQDGGDKASSAEDGKAKDENSSTDSSQEQSEGSSSEQASQSDASSGGLGHPAQQRLTQPRTLALHLLLVLCQRTRSLNPSPPLHRRPARFPFASASIARARKAMAWEASLMAPRCTTPCARPVLPFPARPIM